MARSFQSTSTVLVACLILLLAACSSGGSDSDSGSAGDVATAEEAPTEDASTTAEVTESEATDEGGASPADDGDADGELRTVRVALSSNAEPFAPILVGDEFGTFEAEGIEIEFLVAPANETLILAARGEADVRVGSASAATFNAIAGGTDVRFVAPLSGQNPEGRPGMWVTQELTGGEPFSPEMLDGETIGSALGSGGQISYQIDRELQTAGLSIADVNFQQLGSTDILVALESGALKAGWLTDPVWLAAESSDADLEFAFGYEAAESHGVMVYGPTLFRDDRELGMAFMRGYLAAVREYLQGDYHADDEVVQFLADANEVDVERIRSAPSLIFSPDLQFGPPTFAQDFQAAYQREGVLEYDELLPDEQLVDLEFAEAAVEAADE